MWRYIQKQSMQLTKTVLILLCLLVSFNSLGEGLTKPTGFEWSNSGPKGTNFLLPKDWFLKIEKDNQTYAVFITKEKIEKNKKFLTGLTVNALKNIKKRTKLKPSEYATNFFKIILKGKELYKKPWIRKNGDFISYGIQVKDSITIMHHFLLANDKKDILFMVLFESPVEKWHKNWHIGKTILDHMIFDDEI